MPQETRWPGCWYHTQAYHAYSRHTFGSLAGDAIPIQMLQKLYRHSNVLTTIGCQQNFIHQAADDALDKVISAAHSTTAKEEKMLRSKNRKTINPLELTNEECRAYLIAMDR